jgi:hypothetical protein
MRRPHLFSDSEVVIAKRLPKPVFEYHLDTLTSRKQEYEFEHFARKIAEKEICPNLVPQSGPTGGGDGKVDTETYAVSELISALWYQGDANRAGSEQWGFAFSAKKKWKPKVESDVKAIAETGRGYKRIYFVTNQFVKASTRKATEDSLTKASKIPVTILDRQWISEIVYEKNGLQIALDALNIDGYESRQDIKPGSRDLNRNEELEELERQIATQNRYQGVRYQLVEDCLNAAMIARSLELPRTEVDGRFLRARRIAEEVGDRRQTLRVIYNIAWTTFWWFEDYHRFVKLYDEVAELALASEYASTLEKLSNLQMPLKVSLENVDASTSAEELKPRQQALLSRLEILSADTTRFSNAVLAKSQLVFHQVGFSGGDAGHLTEAVSELAELVRRARFVESAIAERITGFVLEFADILGEIDGYDALFEKVVEFNAERSSDLETGRTLLHRGYQKLRAKKNYAAIKLLGRAEQYLSVRENAEEFCAALAGCGLAYEAVDLLWAARANFISAASQALADWNNGDVVSQTIHYLSQLIWLELRLGRPWGALQWFEVLDSIAPSALFTETDRKHFRENRDSLDHSFGILLLKADIWELKWLDFLPGLLDAAGLYYSRWFLMYALGYETQLRSEVQDIEPNVDLLAWFTGTMTQEAATDIPHEINLLREREVHFKSLIAGCKLRITAPNRIASIYLAETILGVLESFLATSMDKGIFPRRKEMALKIVPKDKVGIPSSDVDWDHESGEVQIPFREPDGELTVDEREEFRKWLWEFVIRATVEAFMISEPERFIREMQVDEQAMGRALGFSEVRISMDNILGRKPKLRLSDWNQTASPEKFPLIRKESWSTGIDFPAHASEVDLPDIHSEDDHLKFLNTIRHTDIDFQSVIDMSLWDRAGWVGISYFVFDELDTLPLFGIGFKNVEYGNRIFEQWKKDFGEIDRDETLRVSVVTGVNKLEPSHYKVVIGLNPNATMRRVSLTYFMQRIHYLEPTTTKNLDRFLLRYDRLRKYVLLPVHMDNDDIPTEPRWDLGIQKCEISVTEAWRLSEYSPEISAITPDMEPIIPEGKDAEAILRRLRSLRSK